MKEIKAYYCNKPCKIIADLGDESVIEILTSLVYGVDEIGYEECDPEFSKIIVDRKYIYFNKIDIEKEFKQMNAEIEARQYEADKKMREQRQVAQLELKSLKNELQEKAKQFEGFETMLKYFDGTIKYVLYNDKLKKLDEIFSNYDETQLACVSFRAKDNRSIQMYIGQYYDYSGSNHEAVGFETLEEAKEYIIKDLNNNIGSFLEETERSIEARISFCDELDIENENVISLNNKLDEIKRKQREYRKKELEEKLANL